MYIKGVIKMISVQNVTKHYGKTKALTNVHLTINKGICFGLVGPNGAGKSTLIKILSGVIKEYMGSIEQPDESDYRLGYVPQDICLEEKLSALTNLKFYGKINGLKGRALQDKVTEVLDAIGLTERAKEKVATFSGGMKRRLNIGCALMNDPDIIIMDEPTVGVDPQSRRYIFKMIEQMKKQGTTIIYASHYMEEIETLCDEVAFIDDGEIVEKGQITELLHRYAQPGIIVKGEWEDNWIESYGEVVETDGSYFIQTNEPLVKIAEVATYCQANDIQLEQLSLTKTRLEDIFFSLTGTALR